MKNSFRPALIFLLTAIYYSSAWLSLHLAFQNTNASPVWPPSGIAFAMIWILGYRVWPSIFLGAFLVNTITFLANHFASPLTVGIVSFFIGVGNTLEAVLGCFILKRCIHHVTPFYKVKDVLKFFFIPMLTCLSSSLIGPTVICLSKGIFWELFRTIWFTWWLGDVSGIWTVAPIFLIFYKNAGLKLTKRQAVEAFFLLTMLIMISVAVFTNRSPIFFQRTYFLLPLIVWSAYRFSFPGASLAVLVTLGIAIGGTVKGLGPFGYEDLNFALLSLLFFIGIISLTGFILAAANKEREQIKTEHKLAEERYRYIVEAALDAIISIDDQGKIVEWNQQAEAIFGWSRDEVLGKTLSKIIIPVSLREAHKKGLKHLLETGEGPMLNKRIEITALHHNGHEFPVELSITSLRLQDRIIFSAFVRDITQRKLSEEILKRDSESLKELIEERSKELVWAQKQLKEASRLADIGTLAATVAHELRNPLGVIQMATFNLKRKRKDLLEDKHLANIEKKVWEGDQIINNLLNYSRLRVPCYEQIQILKILEECILTVQNRFQDAQILIERQYDIDDNLFIEADPFQLIEIFNNIFMNAYQALPNKQGNVQVSVGVESKKFVRVAVKDNGVGIDKEDLDKVFYPFFTKKSKGTGLGLAICNELVNVHHGEIKILSERGKGSMVSVILPITQNH